MITWYIILAIQNKVKIKNMVAKRLGFFNPIVKEKQK